MNLNFLNTDYLSRTFHFADQEEEEQAKRASLIRITFLTVFFGFLWCMSYVFLGLALATTGVVLYISTTLINVLFFRITKRYVTFRFIQLVLILFLPAITQMLLGGYMKGSAVGMAIMLGPTGALMFASTRTARGFFYATVAVFLGMGIWERLDPGLGIVQFSDDINLLFFATNSAAISAVFYFVIEFFLKEKDRFQHMLHDRNKEVLEKNEELKMQQEEIMAQRDSLERNNAELNKAFEQISVQSDIIRKKNEDITSSINYAKRIQEAIMPQEHILTDYLKESFILFKPRDIVSGDFFWFAVADDKLVVTAVDCTGHGVPGALMSMIGCNLLHQIVNERGILEPDQILNEMHDGVQRTLKQGQNGSRDGMDMALCVVDKKNKWLKYAGAKNPLLYIQDGQEHVVKANRFPIGGRVLDESEPYQCHTILLDRPTTFYLYSDGFQDQFGEANNRKYMSKNFRDLLVRVHHLPMDQQRQALDQELESWKGYIKQLDDVLVLGGRIA